MELAPDSEPGIDLEDLPWLEDLYERLERFLALAPPAPDVRTDRWLAWENALVDSVRPAVPRIYRFAIGRPTEANDRTVGLLFDAADHQVQIEIDLDQGLVM